jgi:hypothetical protein
MYKRRKKYDFHRNPQAEVVLNGQPLEFSNTLSIALSEICWDDPIKILP